MTKLAEWAVVALGLVVGALLAGCGGAGSSENGPSGVHLLSADGPSAQVTVPASGHVGPVVDVSVDGSPLLLSVSAAGRLTERGIALVAGDVDLSDYRLGQGLEGSAWLPHVPDEPAWLYLPRAEIGEYQLVVPAELAEETLSLELHEASTPERADLVGTWQLFDAERFTRFGADGDLELSGTQPEINKSGRWSYADGELQWTFADDQASSDDQASILRRVGLLPNGNLVMVHVGDEVPVTDPESSDTPFEPLTQTGRVSILRPTAS